MATTNTEPTSRASDPAARRQPARRYGQLAEFSDGQRTIRSNLGTTAAARMRPLAVARRLRLHRATAAPVRSTSATPAAAPPAQATAARGIRRQQCRALRPIAGGAPSGSADASGGGADGGASDGGAPGDGGSDGGSGATSTGAQRCDRRTVRDRGGCGPSRGSRRQQRSLQDIVNTGRSDRWPQRQQSCEWNVDALNGNALDGVLSGNALDGLPGADRSHAHHFRCRRLRFHPGRPRRRERRPGR